MALIKNLNKVYKNSRVHQEVKADYTIVSKEGKKYIQIDTYGSNEREIKGKVSQSIQFDSDSAKQLINIIRDEL
jgi:hypothetical protein